MVRMCAVSYCNSSSLKESVSLHKFPADRKLKKLWSCAAKIKKLPTVPLMCSLHFEKSCFEELRGHARLKSDAVPTLFDFPARKIKNGPKKRGGKAKETQILNTQVEETGQYEEIEIKHEPLPLLEIPLKAQLGELLPNSDNSDSSQVRLEESPKIKTEKFEMCQIKVEPSETFTETQENDPLANLDNSGTQNVENSSPSIDKSMETESPTYYHYEELYKDTEGTKKLVEENPLINHFLIPQSDALSKRKIEDGNIESLSSSSEPSKVQDKKGKSDLDSVESSSSCSSEQEFLTMSDEEICKNLSRSTLNRLNRFNRRRFRRPKFAYVGECDLIDFSSPEKAKRNWDVALSQISKQKKQIDTLKQENIRLKIKVDELQNMIAKMNEHIMNLI